MQIVQATEKSEHSKSTINVQLDTFGVRLNKWKFRLPSQTAATKIDA